MTAWELYFLLKLDDIQALLIGFSVISGASLFVSAIVLSVEELWYTRWKIIPISSLIVMLFFSLTATIIPSTKQMTAVLVVPALINNEKIQELPSELLELLDMGINKAKKSLEEK